MDDPTPNLTPAAHTNDGFFKAVFSRRENAAAFFRSHLPPAISSRIHWDSLTVLPGSFVKSNLQKVHSDLLFSATAGDAPVLLYLLFEHQSSPDPAMPLRMLGYMAEICIRHHKSHGLPLPAVLPFVFHQGPEPWTTSTAFEDLFKLPEGLATELLPFIPRFSHALLDLTRFDPDPGERDMRLRAVLQLMKLAREKELLRFFRWLAGISASELPEDILGLMLLYALHTDSNLDVAGIYHTLSSNPDLRNNTMSVAEKLRAEGRVEGRVEGLAEGRSLGLLIGGIQAFEEFLDKPRTGSGILETLPLRELEDLHRSMRREYEDRFKRG